MPFSLWLIPLYDNACTKKRLSKKAKTIDENIAQSQVIKKNQQRVQLENEIKDHTKKDRGNYYCLCIEL